MLDADVSKAVGAGLRFRPLAETARDTLAWARTAGPAQPKSGVQLGPVGLTAEREAELLEAWHARGA
jgi:2'-hydroxyisoflavone reductase